MSAETSGANARDMGGRPTDYQVGFCEKAANLCAQGATDFEVAQQLGCHVSTLYRWKALHPEFREALKVGKEASDDRVEASLYHRAVGYSYPAVKIMQSDGVPVIVPYTEHVPPDVGAATLWLTNRRGEDWRAKTSHEHGGVDGGAIPISAIVIFPDGGPGSDDGRANEPGAEKSDSEPVETNSDAAPPAEAS